MSNKNGSNFLLLKNDKYESSSDEENNDYAEGNNHDNLHLHVITENNNEEEQSEESSDKEENMDNDDDTIISDDEEYGGFALLQAEILCLIQDKVTIPKSWILLDSQSIVDVFSNPKFLTNIKESKHVLTLYCNAGKVSVTHKGDLRGYGTVWH